MPIIKKRALPAKRTKTTAPSKAPVAKKKAITKNPTTPKVVRQSRADKDEFGITVGSDQSVILAEMVKGGADKHDVIERCVKMFEGQKTSGGKPKPVSTVVNQLLVAFKERGFTVESTWRFVPPAELKPAAPRQRATKTAAASAPPARKALPKKKATSGAPAKRTARKLPARRKSS